ncbi:MAG: response regulator [Magnetococcales bacterium]|nr:response regulator [Magnetococcales bacterium]
MGGVSNSLTPPPIHRLAFRQTRLAVLAALFIGLFISGVQVTLDLLTEQNRLHQRLEEALDVVRDSAEQAAYNLDVTMAKRVAQGLLRFDFIQSVRFLDNFGSLMTHEEKTVSSGQLDWLVSLVIFDETSLSSDLFHKGETVGQIIIDLDNYRAVQDFIARSSWIILGGILRNLFLALLIATLFHHALTLPLAQLVRQLSSVDPDHPDKNQIQPPANHENDELGIISNTVSSVLRQLALAMNKQKQAEANLRTILQNMPILLEAFDDQGNIVIWNHECERVSGYSADEIVNNTNALEKLYPDPVYREKMIAQWQLRGNNYRHWRWHIRTKQNQKRVISWSNISQTCPIPGWASWSVGIDITTQVQAEADRRIMENRLQAIIDNADSAIFIRNPEGKLLLTNAQSAPLFQQSQHDTHHTIINTAFDRHHQSVLKEGKPKQTEEYIDLNDGIRIYLCNTFPLLDDQNTLFAIGTIATDITARKEIENQLRHAQKMEAIGTLSGGIAHDFNNILGIIIGYAELAELEENQNNQNLSEIIKAAGRGRDLVSQLLSFSRSADHQKEIISLTPLIKEITQFMRATLPASIVVNVDIQTEPVQIHAAPVQIHQILINLCTNASQAMADKEGLLAVRLSKTPLPTQQFQSAKELTPGEYALLEVSDTGSGIAPEHIDRIFDPFFTTKPHGHGTGLGLSVVHGIVTENSGHIGVKSQLGKGTTFTLLFPISDHTSSTKNNNEPRLNRPTPSTPTHIMLVDDETALIRTGQHFLNKAGYNVSTFTDPQEALQVFIEDPVHFNLVITDLSMPNMSGFQLAEQLRIHNPEITILLCSGHIGDADHKKMVQLGIQDSLKKPITSHELIQSVAKNLADQTRQPEHTMNPDPLHQRDS